MLMARLSDYVELMRPVNSIMVGVAIIVSAVITGGIEVFHSWVNAVFAFLVGFTLTGASMVINDYYDRKIDLINMPQRPIPSGRVSPRSAIVFMGLLSVVGLYSSWVTSVETFAVAVFAWIVMMAYSMGGKKTGFMGNLMVSTCISLPFIYGGILSRRILSSLLFSLIAFLSNTGREIIKGIVDIEGDRSAGVKTIAVVQGAKRAALIASVFIFLAVFLSFAPVYLGVVSYWYIPFVAVTDIGLIQCSIKILSEPTKQNSKKVKTRILYLMAIGLLGFAFGSLF